MIRLIFIFGPIIMTYLLLTIGSLNEYWVVGSVMFCIVCFAVACSLGVDSIEIQIDDDEYL